MSAVAPVVHYFVACESVLVNQARPEQKSLYNVVGVLHSLDDPPFPFHVKEMFFYLKLTECRGNGQLSLDIIHDESEAAAMPKRTWSVRFGNRPLAIVTIILRLHDLIFPEEGLYVARLRFENHQIAEQPISVRVKHGR